MTYSFPQAVKEWARIPVDNIAYVNPEQLKNVPDDQFRELVKRFEENRYSLSGWRNYKNKWRDYLGLDTTKNKTILDFGCGFGIESLQFVKSENRIILADINRSSLITAERCLGSYGFKSLQTLVVTGDAPFFDMNGQILSYDIFYSNGVLHHTPRLREILKRACENLANDGEIRLMLYSDVGWVTATNEQLPEVDEDITTNPSFWKFVRFFDEVGTYADWYNREKLEHVVGDFLDVVFCEYITDDDRYLVAVLKKKLS